MSQYHSEADASSLRTMVKVYMGASTVCCVFTGVIGVIAHSGAYLYLASLAALYLVTAVAIPKRLMSQDRMQAAAQWLAYSTCLVPLGVAAVVPAVLLSVLPLAMVGMMTAFYFLEPGPALNRLMGVAFLGVAVAMALGSFYDGVGTAPQLAADLTNAVIGPLLIGIVFVQLIAYRNRLRALLDDVKDANQNLGARVSERTAQLVAANTELATARDTAEEATRAKSAFLATMSHEIRTPLNAVIGMAGLLSDSPLNDEQKDFANTIRSSGDHLLTVINDILDFSKLESGKLPIEQIPFSVATVIEEALDLVAAKAREKNLELAYELATDVPQSVLGDPGRVRQVLLNFLSNAVKFTEKGEIVVSVSAQPAAGGKTGLAFAVKDTGMGMTPEQCGKMFQAFSQADASTTRKFGGTGLGLAISRRLTELMGGQISVESALGKGSTFRFSVVAGVQEAAARVKWQEGKESPLAGIRVWVVDDNDTNRRILRKQCEGWGMVVRDTALPAEALAWARKNDACDLAILDFHMPVMDGAQLCAELHRLHGERIKKLMLSSVGAALDAEAARKIGLSAQVAKPIKHSALFNAILKLFDRKLTVSVSAAATPAAGLPADLAQRVPLRILVAEDNPVNVKLISIILTRLGYRADIAGNGLEAIAALKRQPYDLILMDVQMPEMDGIEATRRICQEYKNGQRPRIIALTAGVLPEERQACLDAGMEEFLDKPVVPAQLVQALERCRKRDAAPQSAALPAAPPGFDPSALERLKKDYRAEDVKELVDSFLDEAPRQIAKMREALKAGDARALGRAVHSIKAVPVMLGAIAFAETCGDMERLAQSGTLDLAARKLTELEAHHRDAELALRAMIQQIS